MEQESQVDLPDGSSRVETIGEVSGMKFTVKHTGFVHGVFHDLRLNVIV